MPSRRKTKPELDDISALLRTDYSSFMQMCFQILNPGTPFKLNWHHELLAAKLAAVARGDIKRLLINIAPRGGKSIAASVALPAWILGHDPTKEVLCVSYAQPLADKLARDTRQVMSSAEYKRAFPGTRLTGSRQAVQEFTTSENGGRLPSSVGGVVTGRGADIIIIDDPLKPDEALSDVQRQSVNNWYSHTLQSRLNDKPTGGIVIIMQRLHEDDLSGFVLGLEPWEVISLPAIATSDELHQIQSAFGTYTHVRLEGEALHPEREPLAVLEALRRGLGEYHFSAQYQQAPTPLGGGMIKEAWFQTFEPRDLPET